MAAVERQGEGQKFSHGHMINRALDFRESSIDRRSLYRYTISFRHKRTPPWLHGLSTMMKF
jgi:hypothetical protein